MRLLTGIIIAISTSACMSIADPSKSPPPLSSAVLAFEDRVWNEYVQHGGRLPRKDAVATFRFEPGRVFVHFQLVPGAIASFTVAFNASSGEVVEYVPGL